MGPVGWQTRGVPQIPPRNPIEPTEPTEPMEPTQPTLGPPVAPEPPGEPCVLLKLGEIVLKGRNRQQFEHILHGNIRAAARDTGVPVEIRQREGVVLLRITEQDADQRGAAGRAQAAGTIAARMRDVPGIVTVCQPLRVAKTPEAVVSAAVALTRDKQIGRASC